MSGIVSLRRNTSVRFAACPGTIYQPPIALIGGGPVANKAKYVDLIFALQPSMFSWNPSVTGNVGPTIEIWLSSSSVNYFFSF